MRERKTRAWTDLPIDRIVGQLSRITCADVNRSNPVRTRQFIIQKIIHVSEHEHVWIEEGDLLESKNSQWAFQENVTGFSTSYSTSSNTLDSRCWLIDYFCGSRTSLSRHMTNGSRSMGQSGVRKTSSWTAKIINQSTPAIQGIWASGIWRRETRNILLKCPLTIFAFQKVAFLDSDMLVLRNMDDLLDYELPGPDWIASVHVCACNPRKLPHYPVDW